MPKNAYAAALDSHYSLFRAESELSHRVDLYTIYQIKNANKQMQEQILELQDQLNQIHNRAH